MLPGLRLILTTFLLGFLAVFVSLRMVTMPLVAQDSLPGLSTPVVAAPLTLAHMPAARPTPMPPPIAPAAIADSLAVESTIPLMFNLDSVISATRSVPEVIPDARDPARAPADELPPLTLLPEMASRSVPQTISAPPELPPLTVLPDIAALPVSNPEPISAEPLLAAMPPEIVLPSVARLAAMPAEAPPLLGVPELALQSAPEPAPPSADMTPIEPLEATDAASEPHATTEVQLAELAPHGLASAAIDAPAGGAEAGEPSAATEQVALLALASPVVNALNSVVEPPPTIVFVRLPVAKPLLRAKTQAKVKPKSKAKKAKTARAKRAAKRLAATHEPFRMIFANPRHRFDVPATWPRKSGEPGIFVQSH